MFYSLAFLLKTGCIDPGVVPRSSPDEVAYQSSLGDEGRCGGGRWEMRVGVEGRGEVGDEGRCGGEGGGGR